MHADPASAVEPGRKKHAKTVLHVPLKTRSSLAPITQSNFEQDTAAGHPATALEPDRKKHAKIILPVPLIRRSSLALIKQLIST